MDGYYGDYYGDYYGEYYDYYNESSETSGANKQKYPNQFNYKKDNQNTYSK